MAYCASSSAGDESLTVVCVRDFTLYLMCLYFMKQRQYCLSDLMGVCKSRLVHTATSLRRQAARNL